MLSYKSLKTQLTLAVLLVSLGLFTAETLIRQFWRLPELERLSQISDVLDLHRVASELQQELTALEGLAYDNAVWDDTYKAIQEQDTTWLTSTFLLPLSFDRLGVTGWYFYSSDGEYVVGASTPRSHRTPYLQNAEELVNLNAIYNLRWRNATPTQIAQTSFLSIDNVPSVLIAHAVLRSDESGSTPGTLLIHQRLDETFIGRITPSLKNDIQLHDISTLPILPSVSFEDIVNIEPEKLLLQSHENRLFLRIDDVNGDPLTALSIAQRPRLYSNALIDKSLLLVMLLSLPFFTLFYCFINRQLLKPIQSMLETISEAQKKRDFTRNTNMHGSNEIHQLGKKLDTLFTLVHIQQQTLKKHNSSLLKLSNTDPLTGLANRRSFDDAMYSLTCASSTNRQPLALLMVDVDYFKRYNDVYGHGQGDEALQQVAQCLSQSVHAATDMVCRIGGEEFVIILTKTSKEAAVKVAENLIDALQQAAIEHKDSPISSCLTLSIGIAHKSIGEDLNTKTLLEEADIGLYEAKGRGRNGYVAFEKKNILKKK